MKKRIAEQLQNIATQFTLVVADQDQIVNILKKAIADEILAAFQYWASANISRGKGKIDADPQFIQHAKEQWQHVEMLTERLKQLGGFPQNNMYNVLKTMEGANSHSIIGAVSNNVCQLLTVALQAEKDAIELYKQMIQLTKNTDPITHKIAKQILEDQQQHKYDLEILKEDICG